MSSLHIIHPHCAGIDIGSENIFIGIEEHDVVSFATFTDEYLKAIAFLQEHHITSVAMEATGVYWIALFDMLEAAGISVCLVNGRQVVMLPTANGFNNYMPTDSCVRVLFPMIPFDNCASTPGCVPIISRWLLPIFNICRRLLI